MSEFNRTEEAEYVCKILDEYKNLDVTTRHSKILEDIERKYEIEFAMSRLPKRQKELLILTNVQKLTNIAAGIKLGITKRTVETIKSHAYKNLYNILVNGESITYSKYRSSI